MSILKEKLNEAMLSKKNDINSFIWKGKKVKVGESFIQEEIKLVNASPEQLKEWYKYCEVMLYNTSKDVPGRYLVLESIHDQRKRCNAELCLRQLESAEENKIPRYKLNLQIQDLLSAEGNESLSAKDLTLGDVSNIDCEYEDIPLNLIIEGCIDKLGVFNRKYLKLSFILKQGLWLTQQEINDLTEHDENGEVRNRLDIVRERLNINKNIEFKINTKGLSYSQLRAMLQLKNKKYSEMTTEQLKTLRNRILFNLENEIKHHILQWENRKMQLEIVAKQKGINLK